MKAGLHTELVGTGRPRFAFLPGLFGRGRTWTQVAQALAAAGYASVLFDLPDHGRSAWTAQFSYPGMALAVAEEIDLRLGSAASLILVGHSMGGKVAMLTALNHPELVAGLVVIDIAPGASDQVHTFSPLVTAMRSLDLGELASRRDADERMREAVPDDDVRLFLLQNLRRKGGWHWQLNLAMLGNSLPQIGDWPDTGDTSYRGPALWLTGDRSDYVKPEHEATMARLFPAVRHQVVADAGHWVHADQPQSVIDALLDVAAGLDAGVSRR